MRTLIFLDPPFPPENKEWKPILEFESKGREVINPSNGQIYKIGLKKVKETSNLERFIVIFLSCLSLGLLPYLSKHAKDICLKGKITIHIAVPAHVYDLVKEGKNVRNIVQGTTLSGSVLSILSIVTEDLSAQAIAFACGQGAAVGAGLGVLFGGLHAMHYLKNQVDSLKPKQRRS